MSAAARLPKEIQATTVRAARASDAGLACSKVKSTIQTPQGFGRSASAAGMVKLEDGETWMHPKDRSWVRRDQWGGITYGVRTTELEGPPPVKVKTVSEAQASKMKEQLKERATIPASMKSYAIAKLGIVDTSNVAAECARRGFVQLGTRWVHPDGSWVNTRQGNITVGWKAHPLQDLPYRRGWT